MFKVQKNIDPCDIWVKVFIDNDVTEASAGDNKIMFEVFINDSVVSINLGAFLERAKIELQFVWGQTNKKRQKCWW